MNFKHYDQELQNDLEILLKDQCFIDRKRQSFDREKLEEYLHEKIYSNCFAPFHNNLKLNRGLYKNYADILKRKVGRLRLGYGVSNPSGFFDYRYNIYIKGDSFQQAFLDQLYFFIKKLYDTNKFDENDYFGFKEWDHETFCVYLTKKMIPYFNDFLHNKINSSWQEEYESLTNKKWVEIKEDLFDKKSRPYFFCKIMHGVFAAPAIFNIDVGYLSEITGYSSENLSNLPRMLSISSQLVKLFSYAVSKIWNENPSLTTKDVSKKVVEYLKNIGWEPAVLIS